MPSLIEAFKEMRGRGLVAKRECYCNQCGREVILESARRRREKGRDVCGFVHFGEFGPAESLEQLRLPLVFGSINGDIVSSGDPGCLAVGEVVADCLTGQSVRYEWDRTPGSRILVRLDESLSGLPPAAHHHERRVIPLGDGARAIRAAAVPDEALDLLDGNPVRLLNVARLRRLGVDAPHLRGPMWLPRVGDRVKLGFYIPDAVAPLARQECGPTIDGLQLEAMWVETTRMAGDRAGRVYRGELVNAPLFIDPKALRIGSPVQFTADHVYPAGKGSKRRCRR